MYGPGYDLHFSGSTVGISSSQAADDRVIATISLIMGFPVRKAAALLLLAFAGCGGPHRHGLEPLTLVRTSPDLTQDIRLYLNQELTLFFSDAIDPLSVTSDSVAVLDADGHRVAFACPPRLGSHTITIVPDIPLQPDLSDGSFRPDSSYELQVAGYPRPDGVAAADGRVLTAGFRRSFRTLPLDTSLLGLPSPLLPLATATMPFMLMPVSDNLPAGDPRPRLLFTLPVLASSLSPAAFDVQRARFTANAGIEIQHLLPRGVRLVTDPREVHPGSTVELDLGTEVALRDGGGYTTLAPDDIVVVELVANDSALRDYAGRAVQMPPGCAKQSHRVVPGGNLPLWEWPTPASRSLEPEGLAPGFEVLRDLTIRPRLCAEAGDGSLGDFHPRRDLVLRADTPFDRGDGTQVISRDGQFPFLSVDIPPGVTVRVETDGLPLRLLACGSMRIQGTLVLASPSFEVRLRPYDFAESSTVLDAVPIALVAGGRIEISGRIAAAVEPQPGHTCCGLIAGGGIERRGPIPRGTVLAVDASSGEARLQGIDDPDAIKVSTRLTPGLPSGARLVVNGATPWARLPEGCPTALLELRTWSPGIQVGMQQAVADPMYPEQPDLRPDRVSPVRRLQGAGEVSFPQATFVRFLIQADVCGDEPVPIGGGLLLRRR